jgi:Toastrack DUF4097
VAGGAPGGVRNIACRRDVLKDMKRLVSAGCLGAVLAAGSACAVGIDHERYIEHEEKRFPADTVMDLHLETFDGPIDVHAWDRPEIVVDIEKRGFDKQAVSTIQVAASRTGNVISVEARHPHAGGLFIGFGGSPTARFTVNVPRETDLTVRTGDGSMLVERVTGRLDLRSGDGSIRAVGTSGRLVVQSGDGSIRLEQIAGRVQATTGDGSLRISGTPDVVRASSGDGSVVLHVASGTVMSDDWLVTTGDGSISAELPRNFDADIEAHPGSDGRAHSDLPLANAEGGARSGRTLRGRLGQGGHALVLRTGDGTIRLTGS